MLDKKAWLAISAAVHPEGAPWGGSQGLVWASPALDSSLREEAQSRWVWHKFRSVELSKML